MARGAGRIVCIGMHGCIERLASGAYGQTAKA